MPFDLHISCTKDVDSLHIDFSDGTAVVTGVPKNTESVSNGQHRAISAGDYIDTDIDYSKVSQEIVEKPEIHQTDRPIKVASELQNLDI